MEFRPFFIYDHVLRSNPFVDSSFLKPHTDHGEEEDTRISTSDPELEISETDGGVLSKNSVAIAENHRLSLVVAKALTLSWMAFFATKALQGT